MDEPQFSQRLWHVNCLELQAVRLALHRFCALLTGQHVLVRSDNTTTVAYINRQGGLCSRCMSQLARHLLIWSHSLTKDTLGTDALVHSWPRGLCKYAFPPVSLLAQTLRKIREDEEQVILVAPYWHNCTWFPELVLLATAPPWPNPLRKDLLTLWHPRPDL